MLVFQFPVAGFLCLFHSLYISLSISFLEEFERNYRQAVIGTISFSSPIRYGDSVTHIFYVVHVFGGTSLGQLFLSMMTDSIKGARAQHLAPYSNH